MSELADEVRSYYDAHVAQRVRSFVDGNARIERAWQTIKRWAGRPARILEVGCGIGDISWRMSRLWPEAEVVGLDIAPAALKVGKILFGSSRLSFVEGPLTKDLVRGKFDLIVLMDVYEHIAAADRPTLHEALGALRADAGRIILSFPTPRHQNWLKENRPEGLQPVDEDIDLNVIRGLAGDVGAEILLFQQISVWHEGDYGHAVIGAYSGFRRAPGAEQGVVPELRKRVSELVFPVVPPRARRLELVRKHLGPGAYSAEPKK